jgi:hypothetical protein
MTPKPAAALPGATPLGLNPQLAPAKLTGFVTPDSNITPGSTPASVDQTVNSGVASANPPGLPGFGTSLPAALPPLPTGSKSGSTTGVIPSSALASTTSAIPSSAIASPSRSNSPQRLTLSQATTTRTPLIPGDTTIIPPGISQRVTRTPASSLPIRPPSDIMDQSFEVRNYQGIVSNSSLENELLNAGYAPLSKIVIRTDGGDKRTQYIKAINKNGQKVFILIDVHGYTTARSTDLTLVESQSASIVPYSLKTGAFNCAGKDVCGVAFECGADAVCVLSGGSDDLIR